MLQTCDDDSAQFGLANIPFGVVSTGADTTPKIATRLRNKVFLIPDLISNGLLDDVQENIRKALSEVGLKSSYEYD